MSSDPPRPEVESPSALPRGTRLGEFELLRVLGIGGFGIVYLAFDHDLEREVAVKEYMPSALAGRTATLHVSLRSQSDADTFALGLKSFVNEARMLARFDHPSLLKVHRFWEANGTAYMAMPVFRGRTLKEERAAMAEAPTEAWVRTLLDPLLGAISTLHDAGVYHRDIAPDNIVIEPDGRPVLLDFGAARRVISDKSQALTAILKPAYAPIEQYGEAVSLKQGPWTDLYALGATLHYVLLGRPPLPATVRTIHDDQPALAGQAVVGCSETFLRTVDWMLAPRPADRPQSVAALRDVLAGRSAPPLRAAAPPPSPQAWEVTQAAPATRPAPAVDFDPATVIAPPTRPVAPKDKVAPPPAQPPVAPAAVERKSRWPVIAGVGAAVVAVAAYGLWPKGQTPPPPSAAASAPLPVASAAAPVAVQAAPVAAPPVAAPPVAAPPEPPPPAAPVVAGPAPAGTSPAAKPRPPAAQAKPQAAPAQQRPAEEVVERPAPEAAAPAPVVVAPPPSPASEAAPAPKAVVTAGPRERCGSRVFLALSLCMERECKKPDSVQHPDCVKWRSDFERATGPRQ